MRSTGLKRYLSKYVDFFSVFSYIADFQVIDACRSFIDKNSQELKEKNLERNFLLHLINLHDFNLITSSQIEEITGKLRGCWKELGPVAC